MDKYPWQERENKRTAERKKPKQKKLYRIKKVSKKEKERLELLKPLAAQFLLDNPVCQCGREGCERPSEVVHHTRSRGKWLLVVATFKALSWQCHGWAHENHFAAEALGLFLNKS